MYLRVSADFFFCVLVVFLPFARLGDRSVGLRWMNHYIFLIIVQQHATYSVYYISVGSSTCFGCRHPSSRARTNVITASGID